MAVADGPSTMTFPSVATVGVSAVLVSFSDQLSEPANRAAIAYRAAVKEAGWEGVAECSASLASVAVEFDPVHVEPDAIIAKCKALLGTRDWLAADMPPGRRLWRIPTVWGGARAPQLEEAAHAAGVDVVTAAAELSSARVRIYTIGFAPGQPYLAQLAPHWDIPRQTALTSEVPPGALVLAIRQFVLFGQPAPTGWRHVGQTAFRTFQPDADDPFPLRQGDEVIFERIDEAALTRLETEDPHMGGAVAEVIP